MGDDCEQVEVEGVVAGGGRQVENEVDCTSSVKDKSVSFTTFLTK